MAERPTRRPTALDFRRFYKPTNDRLGILTRSGFEQLARNAAPSLDLDNARQHLAETARYRQTLPRQQPKARKLPEKQGLDQLFHLVQNLKQDIQFIKDAQSEAGAQRWIDQKNLGDHLYVATEDIDGDQVPDIIVRNKANDDPYIVKGYTTKKSEYPIRHGYYSRYPTARDRKGHALRDFVDDTFVDGYADSGFTRVLNPASVHHAGLVRSKGYAVPEPKGKLTVVQVFKRFLMKPIMRSIKHAITVHNQEQPDAPIRFQLDPQVARNIENTLRTTLITVPVMVRIFGEEVLNSSNEEFQKLSMRKEAKDGFKLHLSYFVENRARFINQLVDTVIELLLENQVTDGTITNVLNYVYQLVHEEFVITNPIQGGSPLPESVTQRAVAPPRFRAARPTPVVDEL